jgi:hypothetical protein
VAVLSTAAVPQVPETHDDLLVSVVMPCLDEAGMVGSCVGAARAALAEAGLTGEIVVVDNGSADGSAGLAAQAGARVVVEPRRGYGSAYLAGFANARGRFIVMGDADGTYEFFALSRFIAELEDGADLVLGSRLRGNIEPGAMPWLHRRVGNPVLTGILNLFFHTRVSDAHCGLRAFRRELLDRLDLQAMGMELASEQLIRAAKLGLDVREIPIDYRPRHGRSKLAPFPDGWRHLRLLLVHSPTWLFLVPGAAMVLGALVMTVLALAVFGASSQLLALVVAALLAIVGSQLLQFGVFARSYAVWHLGERDAGFERVRRRVSLERVLLVGGVIALVGAGLLTGALLGGTPNGSGEEKLAVAGLSLLVLGTQVVFGAFLLSILGLRRRRSEFGARADEGRA